MSARRSSRRGVRRRRARLRDARDAATAARERARADDADARDGGMRENARALTSAQSSDEMFEVMAPPGDDFDAFVDAPTPTGAVKRRADVHADGDWHRSAHVWLVDARTRSVVVQKRSAMKDTFPGAWDVGAAGHVGAEDGGSSRRTARHELAEELGVELEREDALVFQFTVPAAQASFGGCNCFEDVYFARWTRRDEGEDDEDEFAIGLAEVTATKWIGFDALERALADAAARVDAVGAKGPYEYVPRSPLYRELFFERLRAFVADADCDATAA